MAGHGGKSTHGKYFLPIFPSVKAFQHISADKPEKLVVRVKAAEMPHGVKRIAYAYTGYLIIADRCKRHISESQAAHFKPVRAACGTALHILFKGGNTRWHNDYLIKLQRLFKLRNETDVPLVNGVEAPPEYRPAHYFAFKSILGS